MKQMRPPLEIAGISLTPRRLFWAYRELEADCALLDKKRERVLRATEGWGSAHHDVAREYSKKARLLYKIETRLDRILQEMEE